MSIDGHPNNEITAQSPKLRHFCGLGSQEASKHGCWLVQKYNPLSVGGNGPMEFLLFMFRDPESYSGHLDGEKTF